MAAGEGFGSQEGLLIGATHRASLIMMKIVRKRKPDNAESKENSIISREIGGIPMHNGRDWTWVQILIHNNSRRKGRVYENE